MLHTIGSILRREKMPSRCTVYDDMDIKVIRFTPGPCSLITAACSMTQKKDITKQDFKSNNALIKYLFTANHQSPLEHASITVMITGVSRSFLAQITRHRMGSFTSASQHYTTYDEFPNVVSKQLVKTEDIAIQSETFKAIDTCDIIYSRLIGMGIPKEEARQVLPNAKAVNIMWTVNARSLINFFNQRLCRRNVEEMYLFARKMRIKCVDWFPELFSLVGPDCKTLGGCRQGRMKAKECIDANVPNFRR